MTGDDGVEFGHYLPRLLATWPGRARHQSVAGTLLFTDLSGFTALSERLARKGKIGAEEVTAFLNSAFGKLLGTAFAFGGDLLKFGGDALLLVFTGSQHLERAMAAAAGMRSDLQSVNRVTPGIRLQVSQGIHPGQFDAYLVGVTHRELLLVGSGVDAAIAAEESAGPGEIVISGQSAEAIDERYLGESRGLHRLVRRFPSPDRVTPHPSDSADGAAFLPVMVRECLATSAGEGEHRQVTVGFVGFGVGTAGGDRSRETIAAQLEALVSAVQRTATEHSICFLGSDIAASGGKLILTAGAPRSTGNDDEYLLAAMRRIADDDLDLPLQIGVARGRVFTGDVGAPERRTFTVIGDAVNTAARLMAHAGIGEILASPEVVSNARTPFRTRHRDPLVVKGKRAPVAAVSVGPPIEAGAGVGSYEVPLVGRNAELEYLRHALEQAVAERGWLIEVIGEAGIGKSRLLREFVGVVRASGTPLQSIECTPYSSATPYGAFRNALRVVAGIEPYHDDREAAEFLRGTVRDAAPDLLPWLPLIAAPLDLAVPATPETDTLDLKFRKRRMLEAVRDLVLAVIDGPLVLIVEDAHWMDEASIDLLHSLVEVIRQRPWLVVVSRRPVSTGFVPAADGPVETLQVNPLDSSHAAKLIDEAAVTALPEHLRVAFVERAAGNPLFLLELLADPARDSGSLPDSIEALAAARIDRLSASSRRLLRYGAVLGTVFDQPLLEAVVPDLSADAVMWHELEPFLEAPEPGIRRFRHAVYQEAAYEGLPFRRRSEVHEAAGDEILRRTADPTDQAEILSLHFSRTPRHVEAWRYSRIAGDRARDKYANITAAEFYGRALIAARSLPGIESGELAEVAQAQGDVQSMAGLFDEAAASLAVARRFVRSDPLETAKLMRKQGLLDERRGRFSGALRWFTRALRRLEGEPGDDAERIRIDLEISYAGIRERQGRHRDCINWGMRAAARAEQLDYRQGMAHAYYLLNLAFTRLRDPRREKYRALALPILEETGDLVGQANVLNNLGIDAYYEGKWDEALDLYQRSRDARLRAGDVVDAATQDNNIAEIFSDQGRLEEAEQLFRNALRVWTGARFPIGVALARSNLGRVASRAGWIAEGRDLLEQARNEFADIGAIDFVQETEVRLAENRVLAGDHVIAIEMIDKALVDAAGTAILEVPLLRLHGYALWQAGRDAEARASLEESLAAARSAGLLYDEGLGLEALGRVVDGSEGVGFRKEAATVFTVLGIVETPAVPGPGDTDRV